MGDTKIQWAQKVWNPVTGCSKVSPGCQNCYAEKMSKRLGGRYGYPADEPFRVTVHPDRLEEPYKWKKGKRIFVCSMADLFHDEVPDEFIMKAINVIANAQWFFKHTFLVLTKRPERMKKIMEMVKADIDEQRKPIKNPDGTTSLKMTFPFPLPGLWLGVTAENQEMATKRIPILMQIPATVRFVSVEPMLGPVSIGPVKEVHRAYFSRQLDWVICGGESGQKARTMNQEWAESLHDQCKAAGTPFFMKQMSGRTKAEREAIPAHIDIQRFPGEDR